MKKFCLLIFSFFVFINVYAAENVVDLHLFYANTCGHCKKEILFVEEYYKDDEFVVFHKYEVNNSLYNQNLLYKVQEELNFPSNGVPYMVIGNQVLIGFSDQVESNILKIVDYYKEKPYRDIVGEITGDKEINNDIVLDSEINFAQTSFKIPFFGSIDLKKTSLFLISMAIGFVDGFNPCALWVLLFLITMFINMKDRKKMWILGSLFILTSGIVYALFMVTWLNLAVFISKINIIKILISIFAIIVGGINIHKFFKKNDSGCEVTNEKSKKNIIDKIKKIAQSQSFILSVLGIIILSISVNFIELLCSAGLPLMFTNILAMNNLSVASYSFYIFVYMIMFLSVDIVVFVIAMITFKVKAVSTKFTKYSSLIGGIIMLLIGLLLIFKPEYLMLNF